MMTTIAVILFVILCPCVSYIIIRGRITPWSGGIFFVMGDDTLVPVNWGKTQYDISQDAVIKGVFLAGAKENMMPRVSFRKVLRGKDMELTPEMFSYQLIEASDQNGVYMIYSDLMDGKRFSCFILDVSAPYPWSGSDGYHPNMGYHNHVWVNFREK